jgi:hypothetical protein
MTNTHSKLAEIRERLKNATPGPWTYEENEGGIGYVVNATRDVCEDPLPQDGRFIANAPTDISYLLTALEQALSDLAKIEGAG